MQALGATTIYGLNHTIAKGVMPTYITPFGFIMLRVLGASILFWSISFLGPKEKIERKDWGRVMLCSLFGMAINMLAFFKGLDLLIERKKWARLRKISELNKEMLKAEGHKNLVEKIESWISNRVPETIRKSILWKNSIVSHEPYRKLEAKCQNCGASVNPKEVEWIESRYAVCAYCGSILTANE